MPRPDEELEADQRWLRRLARRMARSPASAEDLVQDTYVTALSKPPPDGPMRPWLLGVMRKLAWGEVRSGRRRAHREECFLLTGATVVEPDPLLAYGIDRAGLRSLVEGLPEPFRSTVEQRFLEGLSCVEIAEAAGVPAGTVRWRQSRALELLRAELERPRRRARRGLLWLPLVGLERAMAVAPRALGLSGRARRGLAFVGIALVVAIAALTGGDAPASRVAAAESRTHGESWQGSAAATELELAGVEAANQATLASASLGRAAGDPIAGSARARRDRASRSRSRRAGHEAVPDRRDRDLYDCDDADGDVHCVREPVPDDEPVGGPVCIILDRSLGALARARSRAPGRTIHEAAFLRAARLANTFLAAELGCALTPEPEREERRGGGAASRIPESPAPEREPSCQSEEDETGRSCTTCTDVQGVATTVCAPADCDTSTRTDGTPCTTCTDADGHVESDCEPDTEPEPESGGCESVLRGADVFAREILPILFGEVDLNDPEGSPSFGCTRGPCHGNPGSSALYLDVTDTPENNLERFACFVDLARPEASADLRLSHERGRLRHHPAPRRRSLHRARRPQLPAHPRLHPGERAVVSVGPAAVVATGRVVADDRVAEG